LKEADENRQAIYFAIRKINSPELIGMLWFPWVDAQHQTSSMYLSFGEREDLASLGQEALDLATYYAFMELSLHRLAVTLGADEPEWIALIEENGFLREVLRRENIFTEGHYLDEYVYALLKPEWKERQSRRS
jgi:RimJ/RimL family protein N-acetyltransferase